MSFRDYRIYGKPLARAAAIFILMNINRLFSGPVYQVGLNLVIWATFSVILSFPRSWWTKTRLFAAGCIIIIEAALGLFWFHEMKPLYFIAVFIFAASIHLFMSTSPIPAMAVMFVTALLYIKFGREDLFNFISFGLFAFVLYFTIRSRKQRNEMYELNKRHLAELQEAYDQLQEASVTSMQYAVLEERARIARDIHDAVGHSLTSLIVQMQAMRYMIKKDPVQAEQSLEEMLSVARQGLQDIRTSVHSLAGDRSIPGVIPLKALLSRMETFASVRYTFHADFNEEEVDAGVYGILFRVLQEAITNIIRHSRAAHVEVILRRESGNLTMRIRDDGMLQSGQIISEGFGLKVMKARLEESGGRLHYSIQEPHGLQLIAEIPAFDPNLRHANEKED
ncbi:sensor histidine kinase [Paenibacillus allorhizosphaerae]|uniref:sensor histidine kinase n=1 Tax=Paenibacillus allorhizosphaerae TaxID=2849866 RepID=UPI001C403FF8|nr:sensor histidine kinase [Paenibacillus allorhizosphaerae]